MNTKTFVFALLGIALIGFAIISFKRGDNGVEITSFVECVEAGYPVMESFPRQCRTPDGRTFVEDIGNAAEKADLIQADSPRPNAEITNPLVLSGNARGQWYFEATFPVKVLDKDGNVIGQGFAEAQSDWMTTEFVPFEGTVSFTAETGEVGMVVLEKANPSGLAENADELRVPVRFGQSAAQGSMDVRIHLSVMPPGSNDCTMTEAVTRTVPRTEGVARAALMELFRGPTPAEESQGLFTNINPGVEIQSLTIEDGIAYLDVSEEIEQGVGGSCRVGAIYTQIKNTLLEFPTVNDLVLSVNGRTDDVLQP